jgi:DNA polymerase
MSDPALKLVHESLRQIRDQRGGAMRASAASLARLVATKPRVIEPDPVPVKRIDVRPVELSRELPVVEASAPVFIMEASPGDKAARWAELRGRVIVCEKCPHLVRSRTQVVFGVGNIDAELMFVGEAPGEDEDLQGEPFVGKAGQLLTKIIETMGFKRSDVYIGNVLKCRPDMPEGASGNRKPKPAEMQTCLPFLIEQIEIIKPKLLVALGATAMEGLTGNTEPMNRQRGRWHEFQGIPLMATYHPAYLLRNQSLGEKRKVWEDMLLVLERLGKTITEKQRGYFLQK